MNIRNLVKKFWNTYQPEFSPQLKYNSIDDMPFDEAVRRVDDMVDSPPMYSNEPTLDIQAWQRVQVSATVGEHVMKLKKQGGKDALREWINNLPEENADDNT